MFQSISLQLSEPSRVPLIQWKEAQILIYSMSLKGLQRRGGNIQTQWCERLCCLSKFIVWSTGLLCFCLPSVHLPIIQITWNIITWSDVTVLLTSPCWHQQPSLSDRQTSLLLFEAMLVFFFSDYRQAKTTLNVNNGNKRIVLFVEDLFAWVRERPTSKYTHCFPLAQLVPQAL